MTANIVLSPFVNSVKEFQQLGLANKAIIDATAVDIPLITLSKNENERKERALRQGMVLLIAFVLAPLHAKVFSKLISKSIGLGTHKINQELMQLSFKDLKNVASLKTGIHNLYENLLKEPMPKNLGEHINENLKKNILKAKSRFLAADLGFECLLFSSLGFIKTSFGKTLTGKDQFTGEQGIVEQEKLDQIYKKEKEKQGFFSNKHFKEVVTVGLGVTIPLLLSRLIHKSLSKETNKGIYGFVSNKVAKLFDHNFARHSKFLKGLPLLSDAALLVSALVLTGGELSSARSPREFKELAIQRNSIDFMFFFGAPLFMKLLSGSTTVQGAIDRKKSPKAAALAYVVSYIAASLSVAGIVMLTNKMTRKGVKKEAQNIQNKPVLGNNCHTKQAFNNFLNKGVVTT